MPVGVKSGPQRRALREGRLNQAKPPFPAPVLAVAGAAIPWLQQS